MLTRDTHTTNNSFETKNMIFMFGCDVTDAFVVVVYLVKLTKIVHKFDKIFWKILIMTLKVNLGSRARTHSLRLMKLHKNK